MIFLHTGLPGAGKTLFTLAHLKPLAEAEARQVYYFGIPELQIPSWIELTEDEAMRWYELPAGAVIVIDEAQKLFRPRGAAAKVPEHVARLETHRHNGHDLYLITQHPGLIDANVRKLVGTHRHVVRSFGAKFAVVHKWMQCKDSCDKSRKDSVKEQFRYPKEVFGLYKSAEVHTHKMSIPGKLIFLVTVPFIVLGFGYMAYQGLTVGSVERAQQAVAHAQGVDVAAVQSGVAAGGPQPMPARRPMTELEYLAQYTPRIAGLAHTAPRYDEVTQPVRAPYPAACVKMADRCQCYTEQGTRLPVDAATCAAIVEHGYFRDFEEKQAGGSRDGRSIPTGTREARPLGAPV